MLHVITLDLEYYTYVCCMEKILSKKQQKITERTTLVPYQYRDLRESGTKSWTAVDHLAEKHNVSSSTIYRILKSAKAL